VHVPTFTPIFTIVAFKMWGYDTQNAKIADFWCKFWPRGYIPFILGMVIEEVRTIFAP